MVAGRRGDCRSGPGRDPAQGDIGDVSDKSDALVITYVTFVTHVTCDKDRGQGRSYIRID